MVYPVSWTAVCYVTVITLFIKKVGVVRPNIFLGSGPPPQWLRPWLGLHNLHKQSFTVYHCLFDFDLTFVGPNVCRVLFCVFAFVTFPSDTKSLIPPKRPMTPVPQSSSRPCAVFSKLAFSLSAVKLYGTPYFF